MYRPKLRRQQVSLIERCWLDDPRWENRRPVAVRGTKQEVHV